MLSTVKENLWRESVFTGQSKIWLLFTSPSVSEFRLELCSTVFWPLTQGVRAESQLSKPNLLNMSKSNSSCLRDALLKQTPWTICLRIQGFKLMLTKVEGWSVWTSCHCGHVYGNRQYFARISKGGKRFQKEVWVTCWEGSKIFSQGKVCLHIDVFKTERIFCSLEKCESDEVR